MPIALLIKINKNNPTIISDGFWSLRCITVSFIIFLSMFSIEWLILLGKVQNGVGIKRIRAILSQFNDKVPVVGSNTENRFVIMFSLFV